MLLAGSVAGCSDGGSEANVADPAGTATGTTTDPPASPSPSPTTTPQPELPEAPEARDSAAGREAFAGFVVARWGYALRTNDAETVTGLSPKAALCQGCAELAAELKERARQGWYVDFPGAKVVDVEVTPGEEPGVHVALAKIDVPASRSYFEDGALRNENRARKGATFEVRMRLDGKRYSLLAFRVA